MDIKGKIKARGINEGEEWYLGGTPKRISNRSATEVLEEANQNIEKYRKGYVKLTFSDNNGSPLTNMELIVEQISQEFTFGAPLYELHEAYRTSNTTSTALSTYSHYYKDLLNMATALCYWTEREEPISERFQGEYRYEPFYYSVDWAKSNGLKVKGHPLVWTVPKAIPQWMNRYDLDTQMKFLEVRVRSLIAATKGKVDMWDIANEVLWEPSLRNLRNRNWPHIETTDEILTYLEPAIKWAREENPQAIYVLNDYGMEYDVIPQVPAAVQRKRMIELVNALKDRGAAPDAIGVQAHTGGGWYHAADVKAFLDELSEANIPLQITEFWAHKEDVNLEMTEEEFEVEQAKYCVDFYTMAFSHPSVTSISYWGLMNNLFKNPGTSGMTPRKAYYDLKELIKEKWMTRLSLKTDENSCIDFRAFYGDYIIKYKNKYGVDKNVPLKIQSGQDCRKCITLLDAR